MSTERDPHSHDKPDRNSIETFDFEAIGWRRYPNPNIPGLSFGIITDDTDVGWVIRRDSCAGHHATELIAFEIGEELGDDTTRVDEYPLRYETHETCDEGNEYALSLIKRIENGEIEHPADTPTEPHPSYRRLDL